MVSKAIQLYSVGATEARLEEILYRVAERGFDGVEFAHRFPEADKRSVAEALDDTGLTVVGAHVDLHTLENDLESALEAYGTVGCRDLVIPHLPRRHYRTASRIAALGARLDELGATLADRGFRLHYHNQVHDFLALPGETAVGRLLIGLDRADRRPAANGSHVGRTLGRARDVVGGLGERTFERLYQRERPSGPSSLRRSAYRQLVTATDPDVVGFELDVGAATAAGYGAGPLFELLEDRISFVHLKDVSVDSPHPTNGQRSVDPGAGEVDFGAVIDQARSNDVEWVIFEHEGARASMGTIDMGAQAVDAAMVQSD